MAIKISGTTVIDDSRNVTDVENVGDSNTVYYGSGANLSGVAGGSATFTASGAVSNGDPVVLNSNGTVSSVSGTQAATAGSYIETYVSPSSAAHPAVVYDTANDKVVLFYTDADNSSYGTARVGTVDATNETVTWGTAVVFNSGNTDYIRAVWDPDEEKIIVVYVDAGDNNYGKSIVGTVSGTSISFGTESTFYGSRCDTLAVTYDETADRPVVAYREFNNSNRGSVRRGYYSSTSYITWQSASTFQNSNTGSNSVSLAYAPNQGLIVVCWEDTTNGLGKIASGNATSSTISLNSAVTFDSGVDSSTGGVNYSSLVWDSANSKMVIIWASDSSDGWGVVATVGSSSFTFGTAAEFEADVARYISAAYDSNSGKIAVFYTRQGFSPAGYFGNLLAATVSGTSISYSSKVEYDGGNNDGWRAIAFDPDTSRCIGAYNSNSGTLTGKTIVINADGVDGNLTTENFIGLAAEAISDGATGSITIAGGTNSSQSGLTTGRTHYVQGTSGIGLTVSSPSVVAGTSISSTEVIVRTHR